MLTDGGEAFVSRLRADLGRVIDLIQAARDEQIGAEKERQRLFSRIEELEREVEELKSGSEYYEGGD